MPRPPKNIPTCRLTLEMATEVKKKMEQLRDSTCADSLGEVVRRAVSIYAFLLHAQREGGQVILRLPEGEKEMVLP